MAVPLSRGEAPKVASAIANRIISDINQVFELEGHCMKVGCSVDCSFWKDAGRDYKEIVNQADEALYSAKRSGKKPAKGSLAAGGQYIVVLPSGFFSAVRAKDGHFVVF